MLLATVPLQKSNRKAFGDFSTADILKETGDVEIPFLSGKNQDALKAELNVVPSSSSGGSPSAKKVFLSWMICQLNPHLLRKRLR